MNYKVGWSNELAKARSCLAPNTVTGQFLLDRLGKLEQIHEAEVRSLEEQMRMMVESHKRDREAIARYVPDDANGEPTFPGDFLDYHGGGIFYLGEEGGWDYAKAGLGRHVYIDLEEVDGAAMSLAEVAHRLDEAWNVPASEGKRDEVGALIGRLVAMADAALRRGDF